MSNNITQKLKSHLQAIGLKKLEKIFFALFLLSIPIQTRLTFYTPQTYLNGTFNEYATFFLYLSDIFLITTLFLFFVNHIRKFIENSVINKIFSYLAYNGYNNRYSKFSNKANIIKKTTDLTKISNFSIKNRLIHSYPRLIPITFILITLITWSFASIIWSEYKNPAFYQSIKITELCLLFLYIRCRLHWFGVNKFISLIFISGFLESLIGITQYYLQRSLGLRILMESVLSPEIPNVAKIVIDGERIIRAYGTFPHPNVFSGFLILSIFCGIWLTFSYKTLKIPETVLSTCAFVKKLFHACPSSFVYFLKKVFNLKQNSSIVSRETILGVFFIFGTIIQVTALIFTFSRTAWIASLIIIFTLAIFVARSKLFHACPSKLVYFLKKVSNLKQNPSIVSRETILLEQCWVKQFANFVFNKTTTILAIGIIIPLIIVIGNNWKQISGRTNNLENNYQQSIDYRVLYNNIAISMINKYPVTGIGSKNFTLRMQEFTANPLEWWQFQPAHNVYLIIASEMGIIGLILFLSFVFLVIKKLYLSQKDKIVSHLPDATSTLNKTFNLNNKKEIVSRETILQKAKAGETISIDSIERNKTNQLINRLFNKLIKVLNVEAMMSKRLTTIAIDAKKMAYIKQNNQIVSRETILAQIGLISILTGFLFIDLFDHYFWTLQQGQLTFWIVLGAISAMNNNLNENIELIGSKKDRSLRS